MFQSRQNIESSIFATPDHGLHKLRKAPLLPLFSKKRISDFQPVIQDKLDLFCSKIDQFAATGKPFAINRALTAFSGDVITTYIFGAAYDHLNSPDFKVTFHEAFMAASEAGHIATQFPWIYKLLESLPEWLVLKANPQLNLILQLEKVREHPLQSYAANSYRTSMESSKHYSRELPRRTLITRLFS